LIKIKEYKVSRTGHRGFVVTLPKVWVTDNELDHGDRIDIYRDEEDRLIIIPVKKGETCEQT
jgi:bifunctional DNA-binding transcriptional regulator/antitoxin component of YhaV-PrlF toxin-antitoxin module